VEAGAFKLARPVLLLCLSMMATAVIGQSSFDSPEIPPAFKLDLETAARLRPSLTAASTAISGPYATGALVFDRLTAQVSIPFAGKVMWQLRLVDDDQFNAYSSPDGSIYVDKGLARLAGPSSGLWAAILSHEIAHVVRRDWARRYLYQKNLENNSSASIVMGDPGLPTASWSDSGKASSDLARFCRRLEVDADREGLMLMARAGYHPDFVPALHHVLHAQQGHSKAASLYAMHPCWEERDRELGQAYVAASSEFEHRWQEWYATPGGNPPVVVFADEPVVHKTAPGQWEIKVPIRCQNLAGAVEVVVRGGDHNNGRLDSLPQPAQNDPDNELRQVTGCTSPRTTVTFVLGENSSHHRSATWTDIYVLDAWGSVLARADVPKLH